MRFVWRGILCAMLCFQCSLFAQGPGASLTGEVRDPSGAMVATAKVTARNTGTNVSHSTVTDTAGIFVIPDLQPGIYDITVEAPGFNKDLSSGILLQVAQRARVDFALKLGS